MQHTFRAVTHSPGILIWRIEKMDLVLVPEKVHGQFYESDCYLLLSTRKAGKSAYYDIHYWIGSMSTLDEQGAAAVYAIQLDEFLGSSPVQYREVQHHESSIFCGYFKQGIIYKSGGVSSGMNHVETNTYNIQRLLHVKGKRKVTGTEVEMSWSSFDTGSVFLLDLGQTILQWNGPESNRQERLKGMMLAKDIRDRERGGRAEIGVIEGDAEANSQSLMDVMVSYLGERPSKLPSGTPDEITDQEQMSKLTLYHVSDAKGSMNITEIGCSPLTQDMLNHDDCYILDQGGMSIFVWKGKTANKAERQAAMTRALEFIKLKGYPLTTKVEALSDGGESALFKQLFKSWTVREQTAGLGQTHTVGRVADVPQEKFDASRMHVMPDVAAQERLVDDGSGQKQVWRIKSLEMVEVDPEMHGYFYGGDCYLILYSYEVNGRKNHILYMWKGRHASQDEVTACAYQAVTLDQQHGGQPVQVIVSMGKEPRHFMAIFKGKMVIFEGGTSRKSAPEPEPPVRLFQICGSHQTNSKAIEVPALSASLNSNDVFLLKSQNGIFLWYGKGSSGDERAMAKEVASFIGRGSSEEVMAEGQEPYEFWETLGGKGPYASDRRLQQVTLDHQPRLFECSNKTGKFLATEVTQFTQDDLREDDVMLLDTWDQVFLWIGIEANDVERKESVTTCQEYLRTHPGSRDPDTPIIMVKQGFEPPTFTGWFTAWDPTKWSGGKTYEQLKEELGEITLPTKVESGSTDAESEPVSQYPAEMLMNKLSGDLPENVDPRSQRVSLPTAQEAVQLRSDLVDLCSLGGFQLTKWVSNSRTVLSAIEEEKRGDNIRSLDLDKDKLPVDHALGLQWNVEDDTFRFTIILNEKPHTRRGILSMVSSVFDPLGLLAPLTLPAKQFLQQLCKEGYGWDKPIPTSQLRQWLCWIHDLPKLAAFSVPRCKKPNGFGKPQSFQLHHFSDASELRYGTVSYIRMTQ
ncbi:advillin-like [Carassius auratus]|uniref:Advillin-like n=1 Tax=Carassius auratus TaxID=7957 RepID=A0A6P6L2T7_CARAU|nr:advillin-like [Carassius auratus]